MDYSDQAKKLGINSHGKIIVHKYIDMEGAFKLLENRTFKFSNPNDFNDPFDLYDNLIDFSKYEYLNDYKLTRQNRRIIKKTPEAKVKSKLMHEWKKFKNILELAASAKFTAIF